MLKDNHAKLIADSARHFKEQFLNVRFLLPFSSFSFLWLLPPIEGEAKYVVEMSEWVSGYVSVTVEFRSCPHSWC